MQDIKNGNSGGGMLAAVTQRYEEVKAEILKRWGAEYFETLFTGQIQYSDHGEAIVAKMQEAIVLQRPFVIGFTGTSVTAGHDNLFEESYPRVVHSQLGRIFAATGVAFEGRNGAMGNNPPAPYEFCLSRFAGADPDIVSWEMNMMVAGHQCPGADVEAFVRTALALPSQPAVLVLANVAGEHRCEGAPPDRSWDMEGYLGRGGNCGGKSKAPGADLFSVYREFGIHSLDPQFEAKRKTCNDPRYTRDQLTGGDFKAGPRKAPWHPNRNGHHLMGSILTLHYGQLLLRAVAALETAVPGVSAVALFNSPAVQDATLAALKLPGRSGAAARDTLPPAFLCGDWVLCRDAGRYRCATAHTPDYDATHGSDLLSLVWETPLAPVIKDAIAPAHGGEGRWALVINEDSAFEFPEDGRQYPIDGKGTLVGGRTAGPLQLRFEVLGAGGGGGGSGGGVGVCHSHFIQRALYEDPADVVFFLDGTRVENVVDFDEPSRPREPATGDQCVWMDAFVGPGSHVLRIEPQKDAPPADLVAVAWLFYPA